VNAGAGKRAAAPFSPRVVLGLLVVGALAFIATLYFIGAGENPGGDNDGGAHAASAGLDGYAALAHLLEAQGHQVSLIHNPAQLKSESLLIVTPPLYADPEKLGEMVAERRYVGPTLIVLPKWQSFRVPAAVGGKTRRGWVMLADAESPSWAQGFLHEAPIELRITEQPKGKANWSGFGLSGRLPDPSKVQTATSEALVPLVRDAAGQDLASFWDNGGYYPLLAEIAGTEPQSGDQVDEELWPVVIVAEPDLMNNYGLADRERAKLALAIVDAAIEDYDLPIAFDLTFNGLGRSANLLTLAFTPPFLAATLCLLIAAIVVAWRAFRRFGPAVAEAPAIAFGKRQLAVNGAALIQRSRRLHLLGAPYAALLRGRVARLLGLRAGEDAARTEADIDHLLAARGFDPGSFSHHADALRRARGPHDLLRQAHALRQIERTLSK